MADKAGIKILRYYLQKLKNFFFSKDILSFLLFFCLAAGFWFVHALGKERISTIEIPIRYVGLPLNIDITNRPPTELKIVLKDQGLRLLQYPRKQITPVAIDLNPNYFLNGEVLITSDQLSRKLSKYLLMQPTTSVLEVQPDSILLQYRILDSKRVPVRLVSKVEVANQHMLSDVLMPEPNEVTVFGPKSVLDSVKYVCTEVLRLSNVSDTLSRMCKLKPHKLLRYSYNKVRVNINVEPFTEQKILVPVQPVNCPQGLCIRTFPAYVTATYTVGLSRFGKYRGGDIQVFVDYNDLKNNKIGKQKLLVRKNTRYYPNVRILPQEVEFILERK